MAERRPPAERLFERVPAHSLAVFRIAFGAILLWEVLRFFDAGWIREYYVEPAFHFRYFGFEWVKPLPEPWLRAVLAVIGALSVLIAVGWWTRAAAALFFVGFGYFFLLEQARYLNHFYLVLLLALLLAWAPSDRAMSLAAWRRAARARAAAGAAGRAAVDRSPASESSFAPAWALWLVRAQLAIVYAYAALAKMNGDWLRAQPLSMWLRERSDLPILGPLLAQPWAPWVMSYAGLLLDLLVVPGLLWRRTRTVAFALILTFHLMNAALFEIGIFPWLAIAATTIFFEPDWPLRVLGRSSPRAAALAGGLAGSELAGRGLAARGAATGGRADRAVRRATVAALALWVSFQLLFPLRHFLYPGDVSWTEEGHAFSWHMKLRSKTSRATCVVTDPVTGERRLVDPRVELKDWQYRKMSGRPEMILQYAHHLADRFAADGPAGVRRRPQVRAIVDCSLNGRDPQPLVDPSVDLAAENRSLLPAPWIVPLREPLKPAWQITEIDFGE